MSRIDLFGHDEGQKQAKKEARRDKKVSRVNKQANKKIKRLNKKTEGGYNNPQ